MVNASTKPKCKNWPRQLQKVPGARHRPPKKFENTDKAHDDDRNINNYLNTW